MLKKRQVELDFLRCVAVVSVLLCHIEELHGRDQLPRWGKIIVVLLGNNGWMGVDLFFVLSGFLISGLLFREKITYRRIELKRFFIRRGLKIYPAFYVMLLVTLVYYWFTGAPVKLDKLASEVFFVQKLPSCYLAAYMDPGCRRTVLSYTADPSCVRSTIFTGLSRSIWRDAAHFCRRCCGRLSRASAYHENRTLSLPAHIRLHAVPH